MTGAALEKQIAPFLGSCVQQLRHRRATSPAQPQPVKSLAQRQMFQYFEAVLVRPVVEHSRKEEDRDVLFLSSLWLL